jgi:hypothetical protein
MFWNLEIKKVKMVFYESWIKQDENTWYLWNSDLTVKRPIFEIEINFVK